MALKGVFMRHFYDYKRELLTLEFIMKSSVSMPKFKEMTHNNANPFDKIVYMESSYDYNELFCI